MLRKLLFLNIVPGEQIVLSTAKTLLEPLKKTMPDAVEIIMTALQGGKAPAEAAQALAQAVSAREKTIMEEQRNQETANQKNFANLETRLLQLSSEIDQLRTSLAREEKETLRKDKLIDDYQATIESQNRLLAEQHKKLSSLFRSTED